MVLWIGLALLSTSWLFGLDYYHQANWSVWAPMVAVGTAFMMAAPVRLPERRLATVALALSLPALAIAPWPYGIGLVPLMLGLALCGVGLPERFPRQIPAGLLAAGGVLLVQAPALIAYEVVTGRSHELPSFLAPLLVAVGRLMNVDISAYGTTMPVFSMRKMHMLGATWELLLDPVTWCFVAGAMALICWWNWTAQPPGRRWLRALRDLALLLAPIAVWLPFRAALLVALYLHNVLLVDYEATLGGVPLFWNPWAHLALLAGPVLLAWRLVPRPPEPTSDEPAPLAAWRRPAAAALVGLATALAVAAIYWDPVGTRQDGRVLIEEYHPNPEKIWERCDKPFDTEWYGHLSGYNYYCIVDYLSRYYDVTRRDKPLDADALANCDVLVLKVPTRPYSDAEIQSIHDFVDSGGGLLLIGEHTSVFDSGVYLNQVARRYGFTFRYDCLFGIDSVFNQLWKRPLVPHPILQHVPPMEFATSCSLAPTGGGRAAILSTGLKNLGANYHASNFYPQPYNTAEMRYGAFVQLWTTRSGKGRVMAFTDSTIFSNFCTFEPGKAELMLGMIEWLNHRSELPNPRPWLAAAALLLLIGAVVVSRKWNRGGVLFVGAGLFGWSLGVAGVWMAHSMALPAPRPVRPMVRVGVDRTVSKTVLPKSGFIDGKRNGFGIFERWLLRLGYFTARQSEPDLFAQAPETDAPENDLVLIVYPGATISPAAQRKVYEFQQDLNETGQRTGQTPLEPDELRRKVGELRSRLEGSAGDLEDYRNQLVDYVAAGGKLLLIDSPDNEDSTANELLEPFGLSLGPALDSGGILDNTHGWPAVPITSALEVQGGTPFATLRGKPVGATVTHGDGLVAVVGFGTRFNDAEMGFTGDVEPDAAQRTVFDLQFALLRWIVEGTLPETATAKP